MAETKKTTQTPKEEKTKKTTVKKTETKAAKPATKAAKPAAKATAKTTKATAKPATKAASKTTAKASTKATAKTTTKAAAKTTTKAAAKKTTAKAAPVEKKKPVVKTTTPVGFEVKGSGDIDNLLDILSVNPTESVAPAAPQPATKKAAPKAKKEEETPAAKKAPAKTKKEEVKKTVEFKRPERKARTFTKEEKVLYKRLEDAFTYVANLTMVIEERTMDTKQIPDLTLGELHVLEVVNRELTMPMTKAANELKITVGSLTTCVNRLVKKEYLFRERDENDHRIIKISTTPKAKKALKVHEQFHTDILYGILDGVTIRDATKVMTQVARTLENYINPKEKNYEKPIDKKKTKNL